MRKRICILLVICVMITLLPPAVLAADIVESGTWGSNLTWTLDSEGCFTISGTGAMKDFSNSGSISPTSNRRNSIRSVIVGEGITSIGEFAFSNCDKLESADIPDSVTKIGKGAFSSTALNSIAIPQNVRSIGEVAFSYCRSLSQVTIPDGVTSIGKNAFSGCTLIKQLSIPKSVKTIGDPAFYGCSSLQAFSVDKDNEYFFADSNGVLFDKDQKTLNCFPPALSENYTVPDGVIKIAEGFYGCTKLKSVTLPDTLEELGNRAFYNCSGLQHVVLPDSLKTIGDDSFYGCSALESVTFGGHLMRVGANAFKNCKSLKEVYIPDLDAWLTVEWQGEIDLVRGYISSANPLKNGAALYIAGQKITEDTELVIPEGYTTIHDFTFDGLSVKSIVLPSTIESLPKCAFIGFHAKEAHAPSLESWLRITRAGSAGWGMSYSYANPFSNNCDLYFGEEKATSIVIPEGTQTIPAWAFYGCSTIESVTLPAELKSIGEHAFRNCKNLKKVYAPDLEGWYSILLNSSYDSGQYANPLNNGAELYAGQMPVRALVVPGSVTTVPASQFCGCSSIDSVIVPAHVTSVGTKAFDNCSNLKTIMFLNPSCEISSAGVAKTTTIYGYEGSTAEAYAKKNGFRFELLTSQTMPWDQLSIYNLQVDLPVTVYANQNSSDSEDEAFVLCKGATVTYDGQDVTTDENGFVQLTYGGGDITVSKDKYVTRTIPEAAIQACPTVHLQKQSDGPVISGLWMNNTDILHSETAISLTGDEQYTVTPEITWGKDAEQTVKLVQDSRSLAITGGALTLAWGDQFDVTKPIYLVATDAGGRTAMKKLKLTAETILPESLEGFKVNFGDSLSFTLPDSAGDFFSGTKMKAGIYSNIPISFTIEDGKVYAAIGYQKDYSKGDEGMEAKTFAKSLQNVFKKASDGMDNYQMYQNARRAVNGLAGVAQGSFGFDTNWEVMGFAEGYITPEGEVQWLDSGMIIGGGAEAGWSWPFYVGPVPAFFEFKIAGQVQAQANLAISNEAKAFTPNVSINGSLTPSAGLGLGIKNVASVSGGLKGEIPTRWDIYDGATNYLQMKGKLSAYASVGVLCFTYSKDWDLAESVWYEYPEKASLMAAPDEGTTFSPYDTSVYSLADLSYLSTGSEFLPARVMATSEAGQRVLLTNAYRGAEPQLARFDDGTMLAVWLGSDGSAKANDLRLYYTSNTGGTWSEPQPVCADATMDGAPTLCVIGDKAYLAWQNAASDVTEVQSLDALAPMMDISVAVFDREANVFRTTKITENNEKLDMTPVLCGDADQVYVVWQRNNGNQWFGSGSDNDILSRCCVDGVWQEETTVRSGVAPIVSLAADYDGKGLHTAYCLDMDGDLNTVEDIELYEDGARLSENAVLDSGVQYDGHTLYWYQNGQLLSKEGAILERIPTDRYRFVRDGEERAIIFSKQDGLRTTLLAAFLDPGSGRWSEPVPVSDGDPARPSFGAVLTENGLTVLSTDVKVVGDGRDGDPYGEAALVLSNVPLERDLTLETVAYDGASIVDGGDVVLEATVKNSGKTAVHGIRVEITDPEGTRLGSADYADILLPGAAQTIRCGYTPKERQIGNTIIVTVLPLTGADTDTGDNEKTVKLSFRDVTVENMSCGVREDGNSVVYADVVNRSYTPLEKPITVELHKGSADSEAIDHFEIESMDALSSVHAAFTVQGSGSAVYYITIDADNDADLANNQDFVALQYGEPLECEHDYQPKVIPPTCTESGYTVYTCSKCDAAYVDDYVPAAGHQWDSGKVTKEPTESAEGVKTFTCTVCGEMRTESVPKQEPKPVDPPAPTNPFTDVAQGQYFYDPGLWAVNHDPQITKGTSDTAFSPDATCTRGQVVTFIWRAMGEPEPTSTVNRFSDVQTSDYFCKAVLWAVEKGVTLGTSDTTFSPNAPCTRAHVVTFLWRAEGQPQASGANPFTDVASGQYYTDAVLWAVSKNITQGTSATTFSPDNPCTRAQIVTFLYRDMK